MSVDSELEVGFWVNHFILFFYLILGSTAVKYLMNIFEIFQEIENEITKLCAELEEVEKQLQYAHHYNHTAPLSFQAL